MAQQKTRATSEEIVHANSIFEASNTDKTILVKQNGYNIKIRRVASPARQPNVIPDAVLKAYEGAFCPLDYKIES